MKRRIVALSTLFVGINAPSCAGLALPSRSSPAQSSADGGDNGQKGRNTPPRGNSRRNSHRRRFRRQSLFTVKEIVPALDTTALPAISTSTAARLGANDTSTALLAAPYSSYSEFATEMETPSLRQRDDPDDDSCIPHVCGPLPVTYTNGPKIVERWLSDHIPSSGPSFVGFDVESVPNAPWMKHKANYNGPATVQLATPDSAIVIHLTRGYHQRKSTACTAVSALLRDPNLIKVCTGIDEDMLELYRFNSNHRAQSRFDLGGIGSGRGSKHRVGLQRLVRAVLGVELKKQKKLAVSNWSKSPLTKQQVAYAARDAWAGAAVMYDLAERYPDIFAAEKIISLLKDERPIEQVHKRAARRKKARLQLKELLEQYEEFSSVDVLYNVEKVQNGLPPIVVDEINRLKDVMASTSPDGLIGFDAGPIGLVFDDRKP